MSEEAAYQWHGNSAPPEFDQAKADALVGKYILLGVTYLDHSGTLLEQVQYHGIIQSASPEGLLISLRSQRDGETWTMPPVLDAITPAKPGQYNLRSSGEVVEDPDLLSTWSVTKPEKA